MSPVQIGRRLYRRIGSLLRGLPVRRRADAALLAVLLAEAALLTGSFGRYFNQDSIFYVLEAPRSLGELLTLFTQPDAGRQFRPLTLAFAAPLVKWWGADPAPYHWIPLLFHLGNTWLLYRLAGRLTSSPVAAVAAAAFWGLHSVSGWITYDMTYVSDFLSAFLLLVALILAVDGLRLGSRPRSALSLSLFLLALLTKEAATAFPLALLVSLVVAAQPAPAGTVQWRGLWVSVRRAIPWTGAWLALSIALAALLVTWLGAGRLYAQDPASPYRIGALSNPLGKVTYLWWGLNLPARGEAGGMETSTVALMLLPLLVWALSMARRRFRLSPPEIAGILWFAGLCVPAFLLSNRLAKWYLYVPLAGLSIAFGSAFEKLIGPLPERRRRILAPATAILAAAPFLFSSVAQTRSHLEHSTDAFVSEILGSFVTGFTRLFPALPAESTIVFLPSFEDRPSDWAKVLAAPPVNGGRLLRVYYPGSRIRLEFLERGARVPDAAAAGGDTRLVQYLRGHVYDVTGYFLGRRLEPGLRPARNPETMKAEVSRDEFYPDYETFGTPNGRPVFSVVPTGEIITQIGGSRVSAPIDSLPEDARVRFDVSWMYDSGDGGWAELSLRTGDGQSVLFREYMRPNPAGQGLVWKEIAVDLPPGTGGRAAELVLRCYNEPDGNTVSDWLNWRDIAIVRRNGR